MIRALKEQDFKEVNQILSENWLLYQPYINPNLLLESAHLNRMTHIKNELESNSLSNFVYIKDNTVRALLTFGKTADTDKSNAFEIWRVYVSSKCKGQGVGSSLLAFAENKAKELNYKEIIIWTFKENHKAIQFYLKHNYKLNKEIYLGDEYQSYGVRLIKTI